jgi:poly-gamma-glutamate synthesis protein (capsule biosynthesis protein)
MGGAIPRKKEGERRERGEVTSKALALGARASGLGLLGGLVLASLSAAGVPADAGTAAQTGPRLLFAGDVLLSRQVPLEIASTGRSPFAGVSGLFGGRDLVLANLEGAVGADEACLPGKGPCFPIEPELFGILSRAGITALGLANNHAGDLGEEGLKTTRERLAAEGLLALDFERSPRFVRLGKPGTKEAVTVALVALSLVKGRDGTVNDVPSVEVARKLRLARRLASLVVVSVHWGEELLEWPSDAQRAAAAWLVASGASLVVGHHPHVVQPPECVAGRPVFYSLGNLLFDQRYSSSKVGLLADCRVERGALACRGVPTETPLRSSFPRLAQRPDTSFSAIEGCRVPLAEPFEVAGVTLRPVHRGDGLALEGTRDRRVLFTTRAVRSLSLESGRLAGEEGEELLFALERHPSPLDGENGVRPYVYAVGDDGLVARWRGSGLAWPLVDARLLPGGRLLCALHRGDSYLVPGPGAEKLHAEVYRWNGFGFSSVDDESAGAACTALWGLER